MNLEIQLNSEIVGQLDFLPRLGNAKRTAAGFCLDIPAELLLWPTNALKAQPIVTNLSADIYYVDCNNAELELATIRNDGIYEGRTGRNPVPTNFRWTGPLSVLVELERVRNGNAPHFRVRAHGEVGIRIDGPRPGVDLASIPQRFRAQGEIVYPAEQWRDALKAIQLADVVMLEIPLGASAPEGYAEVWQNLIHARDTFLRGGPFAWESCAVAVRRALEAWNKVEPLQLGKKQAGVHRSKRERMDTLRSELEYYLGLGVHLQNDTTTPTTDWTREDALLGLTTLCALLSARRP